MKFGQLSWQVPVRKKKTPGPAWAGLGPMPGGLAAGVPGVHAPAPTPPQPPSSLYDPSIDVNLAAVHRGYGDLQSDIGTQQTRGTTDYLTGVANIGQGASRGFADLLTGNQNESADYGTGTANVARSFASLANQQRQAENAGGTLSGGAAIQAARKRAGNHALEQASLDTAHQRFVAAAKLAGERLSENTGFDQAGHQLADPALTSQLGQLNLLSAPATAENPLGGRSWQDLTTQLQRGGREDTQATLDAATIRGAQAAANGWTPPVHSGKTFGRDAQLPVSPLAAHLLRKRRR